jgi:hypothetical protein
MKYYAVTLAAVACAGLCRGADPATMVLSSSGGDPNAVRAAVAAFQNLLGPLNAPGAGGNAAGRREINWDAVPASFSSPNNLPADFFNKNSVRGAVFSSDNPGWSAFQVSANAADGAVRFDTLNSGYSALFQTFSPEKLFTSIGTNDYNVDFLVPGSAVKGKVKGFGAVFANVALPFSSSIEFFNDDGISLGKYFVPPAPKGLSFVGVVFTKPMVTRVRIVQGTAAIGASENLQNGLNVVALDDFIYGEPQNDCTATAGGQN